ncbi:mitochondrial protein required for respiration [Obba rivulosa]|uniref:SURF1-like protein n=1 Tax=Obba rivulosa TaxID=1052685 RepID=A0A8E2AK87_9APHY|nr:mitochondrial protein required for respiration [Obba rivulosa]
MFSAFRSTFWRNAAWISRRPPKSRVSTFTRSESTSSTSSGPTYKAKREPFITPVLALVGFIPIFTFALGTWQVKRLKWKVDLIDELQEKMEREPIQLPRNVNLAVLPEFVFRKVRLTGRWDMAHAILLGPRVRDGTQGHHLVVPLVRSNGSTVLVDRGFISADHADSALQSQEDGEVEVYGMLRMSSARNMFTPDNVPGKGEWHWADVDALAEYAGGQEANVQPVLIEEIFEGHSGDAAFRLSRGIPIGKLPLVDIRNSHMSYVATWYSLSAFTAFMLVRLILARRRARAALPR